MSIDNRGAHLSRRDVAELAASSERLVVVADTIRASGVKWAEVAVNLLIVVNETIVRLQNKGAGAYARYLAKHPPQKPQDAPEVEIVTDDVRCERSVNPDDREP